MTRQEAIGKLSTIGHISVSYAEDLYDSFFPKPVVPQYVADWYEGHKNNFESEIYYLIRYWESKDRTSDFYEWFDDARNKAIKTLINMHQFGYEVDKETRYTVKVKGVNKNHQWLVFGELTECWWFGAKEKSCYVVLAHTRKELEDADFGWVFDCPGVEVKEVE